MDQQMAPFGDDGFAPDGVTIIDWNGFQRSRAQLGKDFIRLLGYFREDGTRSVAEIETAMREQDTAALIVPAQRLEEQALQFGALPLAALAEMIETTACSCLETRRFPDELVIEVVELRRLFDETMRRIEQVTNPLASRVP